MVGMVQKGMTEENFERLGASNLQKRNLTLLECNEEAGGVVAAQ